MSAADILNLLGYEEFEHHSDHLSDSYSSENDSEIELSHEITTDTLLKEAAKYAWVKACPKEEDVVGNNHFNAELFVEENFLPPRPRAVTDKIYYCTTSQGLTEACKDHDILAQFGMYSFKAGNYNIVFTKCNDITYVYIIDCGFGDGTTYCTKDPEGRYLKLLYHHGWARTEQNIVVKAIILSHGHSDHFNSLKTLLFDVLHVTNIECVILGGNAKTYFSTNKKAAYFRSVLGEICFRYENCKFFHSGFKRHLGDMFKSFDQTIQNFRNFQNGPPTAIVSSMGFYLQTTYNFLGLEQGMLALSMSLSEHFIPFCLYDEQNDQYKRPSEFNGEPILGIDYLSFLNAGYVQLKFPVLNPNFSATPGPCVTSKDENDLSLMVLVVVSTEAVPAANAVATANLFQMAAHAQAAADALQTTAGILQAAADTARATANAQAAANAQAEAKAQAAADAAQVAADAAQVTANTAEVAADAAQATAIARAAADAEKARNALQRAVCRILFMADAPYASFCRMKIQCIDVLITSHHSDSHARCACLNYMRDKNPKIVILPLAERFYTPRRGYIQAHITEFMESLLDVESHDLYYHIFDSAHPLYVENVGNNDEFRQHRSIGTNQMAHTVLYRKKSGCKKAVFTIFDFLILNVAVDNTNDNNTRFAIRQPSKCIYPSDKTIKVHADAENHSINTDDDE